IVGGRAFSAWPGLLFLAALLWLGIGLMLGPAALLRLLSRGRWGPGAAAGAVVLAELALSPICLYVTTPQSLRLPAVQGPLAITRFGSSRAKCKSISSFTLIRPSLSNRFFSSRLISDGISRRIVSSHLSCSTNFSPRRLQREHRNFRYMKLGPNTRTYQLRCST